MRLSGRLPVPDSLVGPSWRPSTIGEWMAGWPVAGGVAAGRGGGGGRRCWYCGTGEAAGWHREHQTPRSRGGSNRPGNLVDSCATCNLEKGPLSVEEFRSKRERQRRAGPVVFFGEAVPGARVPEEPWSWYRVFLPDELAAQVELAAAAEERSPKDWVVGALSLRLRELRQRGERLERSAGPARERLKLLR